MYRIMLPNVALLHGFLFCTIAFASRVVANISRDPESIHATTTLLASPHSVITPPPVIHGDLFKRALATCGYVRGNSASPLTCADGYSCVTTAHLQAAFACCDSIECLDDWGICHNYGQTDCAPQGYTLSASVCSSIYGSILSCSQEAPSCFRYARSSSRGAYFTYYSYGCGTDSSDVLVLATATNGNQAQTSNPTSAGSIRFASVAGVTNPPYASASTTYGGSSGGSGNKRKLSIHWIVLIIMFGGGASCIALIFGFRILSRRRKQKNNAVYNPQPPPPSYPPTATNVPGPSPIIPWNNSAPVALPLSVLPIKSTASETSRIEVHEMNAPARSLHEMPGGHE